MKLQLKTHWKKMGFSLHQSGTVMKLYVLSDGGGSCFSLHQSGTVMKF